MKCLLVSALSRRLLYVTRYSCRGVTTYSASPLSKQSSNLIQVHAQTSENPIQKDKALCLLVGWTASKHKVLAKYAPLYTDVGIPCVALSPTMPTVWFSSYGDSLTKTTIETLNEMSDSNSPTSLIIHIFSGGGNVIFPKLLESWSSPDSIFRTRMIPKCVIFDSAPTDFSFKSGTAASRLLLKQGALNPLTYTIANTIGTITNALIGTQKRSTLHSALVSDFLDIPQLYLHSKNDSVATFDWVNDVIERQQEKGRLVTSHCWDDTEHLRLYLEHKDEYTQHIRSFLRANKIL